MRPVFVRRVQPVFPRRFNAAHVRRVGLGDFFDDLANSVNLTSSPDLTVPLQPLVDTAPVSIPNVSYDSTGALVQYNPATSDSSFSGLLQNIGKVLSPIAQAYTQVKTADAAASLAARQPAAAVATPLQSIGSIFSGPYGPYIIGGGFIALALFVSSGSGKRR